MDLVPFERWPLKATLHEKLQEAGFSMPTEVQQACWDKVRVGGDLLVQSCTGTGKTLAFALPLLNNLDFQHKNKAVTSILIVLPTRELAMQVARVIASLGAPTALLYGGGSYHEQMRALKSDASVVVGTPGRLLDHLERGTLHLENCHTLVLDEADEILDMGFAEEVDKILAALPSERQTLLFSATIPPQMEELAQKTLRAGCQRISISVGLTAAQDIRHTAYLISEKWRAKALCNILFTEDPQLAIIFCHTKAETDELAQTMIEAGLNVLSLHGDMAQNERTRTLSAFRSGLSRYLIATDVAARGLDVEGVTHVINMAVPRSTEIYIHRVGRTGRAGNTGRAITFVAKHEFNRFKRLLAKADILLDLAVVPQAEDVRKHLKANFHKQITENLAGKVSDKERILAAEILSYLSPVDGLAAVLSMSSKAQAIFTAGGNVPMQSLPEQVDAGRKERNRKDGSGKRSSKAADSVRAGARGVGEPKASHNRLLEQFAAKAELAAWEGRSFIQINLGRSDGLSVLTILHMLEEFTHLRGAEIGNIELRSHTSFVELPQSKTAQVLEILNNHDFGPTRLRARLITADKFKVLHPSVVKKKKRDSRKNHSSARNGRN